MRRRLDIAASIVVTPELLFLDEPTTGLDPRSRNQVWDIVRALREAGTTILLCTQYLDEADQLADGIAVIDHGKVIAEGTPGQLKASVGSGALHVRLLDPEQREEAYAILERELGATQREPDPSALTAPCASADRGAQAVAALAQQGIGLAGFTLGQPSLDEVFLALTGHPAEESDGGGDGMSIESDTLRNALASTPAPAAGHRAASAALAFGWRGMLKVRHVPEQLLDVTITPVMFLLMFTYLFGGAIEGSTGEYLDYVLPGILVMSVLFTTVYSGVALNTDLTKGVVDRFRSAADRQARAARRRAARRHRPLPRGGHGDRRARRDPRLPPGRRRPRRARRAGGHDRLRVRAQLGLHHARPAAALPERGHERRLHGDLPADVPVQRVRRPRRRCPARSRRSSRSTRSASWRR